MKFLFMIAITTTVAFIITSCGYDSNGSCICKAPPGVPDKPVCIEYSVDHYTRDSAKKKCQTFILCSYRNAECPVVGLVGICETYKEDFYFYDTDKKQEEKSTCNNGYSRWVD